MQDAPGEAPGDASSRPSESGLTTAPFDGCFVSFGVPYRVWAADSRLAEAILTRLPHDSHPVPDLPGGVATFSLLSPMGAHGFRSLVGLEVSSESALAEPALEQMGRNLMVHVANFAPDRVFLHAGVVGWQGRAILLPGPSFAGKTTLTAALVRAGATYYSDEYAVLDQDGMVHPYTRDLQMREPGGMEQRGLAVSSLNGSAGSEPLRAAAVVFAQYRSGARWTPEQVTPGMAVLEMLRHTIPVQRTPARVMATLARTVEGATIWRSERDEADEVARMLLRTPA